MAETLKEIVKELGKVREMLAMLNSPMGEKFRDKDTISKASKTYYDLMGKIDGRVWETTSSDQLSSSAKEAVSEITQWTDLMSVMSDTSHKDRKVAQLKVDLLYEKLQNALSYEPESYFNTYFYTNTLGIDDNKIDVFTDTFVKNSQSFQDWFGNSVLKDEDGNPIVYYHGAKKDEFVRFDFDVFPGMYFAENRKYAEWFQKQNNGNLYEVYLDVSNPIDLRLFGTDKITYDEFVGYIELKYGYKLTPSKMLKALSDLDGGTWAWRYLRMSPDWLKQISEGGYFDGIRFFENNPDDKNKSGEDAVTSAVMVFRPEQIKLAKGNLTFAKSSKDIRFGLGGFILGGLAGGYVGYKIGRSMPAKTGFDTEKKLAKQVRDKFRKKRGFIKHHVRKAEGGKAHDYDTMHNVELNSYYKSRFAINNTEGLSRDRLIENLRKSDNLNSFERWKEGPGFQNTITEMNEKDIAYENWSDYQIFKWWIHNDTE